MEELIERFSLDELGKRNLQLKDESLLSYGKLAMRQTPYTDLKEIIKEAVSKELHVEPNDEYLSKVARFLKENEEDFSHLKQLTSGKFK